MRFRDRLARFFYGRNGTAHLCRFLLWESIILVILSMIFTKFVNPAVGSVMWMLGLISLVYCYFRMLSKNIYKRQQENQRYLQKSAKIRGWFSLQRDKIKYRKDYSFFFCPSCKPVLRVPKGKGKIKIKCHKCGEVFIRKS